jgi:hypothetical protein
MNTKFILSLYKVMPLERSYHTKPITIVLAMIQAIINESNLELLVTLMHKLRNQETFIYSSLIRTKGFARYPRSYTCIQSLSP